MEPLHQLIISPEFLRTIAAIDEFKGKWMALRGLAPERLSSLRRIATIESVGSSTRIEGVRLTNDEIERLLAGLDVRSFRSRDEQEVAGYSDVMELVFESYDAIPLSENHIKQLHATLLRYSEKDQRHRGEYKKLPNHVEAFDDRGRSIGVVFETASPFDTPRLMETLVGWTSRALDSGEHHVLLVIAAFVVRFLAIHPFQDGNGRLSRALTTLLLLRAGYDYVPYSSLERIIEDNKDEYYRALRRAQSTLDGDESQLGDWLLFFVRSLASQMAHLEHKIEREHLVAPLPPLSEKLLEIVRDRGRISVQLAVNQTGANRNTVKDHLQRLVKAGHIVRHGRGRGTYYGRSQLGAARRPMSAASDRRPGSHHFKL
jgi:Fic family protein